MYRKNAELRVPLGKADQYSGKGKVIIQDIPTSERENVKGFTNMMTNSLKVKLSEYKICAVHRLLSKNTAAPPICVKLNFDKKKELIVAARKKKFNSSDLGIGMQKPILIDKYLTREVK